MTDRRNPPAPVPLHRLAVPDPQAVPVAVGDFDSIGPLSRADFPHRHTFVEIVLVTAGSGRHVIDGHDYPIEPPQFGLIAPGHVHHWHLESRMDGSVLLFDASLIADERLGLEHRFATVPEPTAERLGQIMSHMEDECRTRDAGFLTAVRSYLRILLTIARRCDAHPATPARIADGFARLVADRRHDWPPLDWYARRLGVSSAHLHERVKDATGAAPGSLIRRARAHEALRLLIGTDLSVRQVASRVGFDDPAYFCRFFRREIGLSPGEYRRRHSPA